MIFKKNKIVSKVEFGKYFYMLMLFLWCAYTAPFLKPFDSQYLVSSFIYVVIYILYFVKYCLRKNNKPFAILFFICLGWYIIQCIKWRSVTSIDFRLFYSLILCHVAFYLYKEKEFFFYFEKVLVHFTLLSLFVWVLAIIAPTMMHSLFDRISVWSNGYTTYGNVIVVALGNQYSLGILRNIGFTWEAGRFASFLVVGLFISLLLNNMHIRGNRSFFIFLIGLISTLSTTGIVAAIIVIFFYAHNKNVVSKFMIIVLGLMLIPLIWSMDFIGEKIIQNIDVYQEIDNMQWTFEHADRSITPQRFTGFYLDFQNWIHDFWFGYNLNENSYVQKILFNGNEVWLSNGIIQIFSKYGIFIGLFFYYCLFRSSRKIVQDFNFKGAYVFALLFLIISISYDFWASGIFLYLILYGFYNESLKL